MENDEDAEQTSFVDAGESSVVQVLGSIFYSSTSIFFSVLLLLNDES